MGDLGAETFLLLMSVVLERAEDELELKLVVHLPFQIEFDHTVDRNLMI